MNSVTFLAVLLTVALGCTEFNKCVDCVEYDGCGWCTDSNTCLSGNEDGPDSSASDSSEGGTCSGGSWIHDFMSYSGSASGVTSADLCSRKFTHAPTAAGDTTRVPSTQPPGSSTTRSPTSASTTRAPGSTTAAPSSTTRAPGSTTAAPSSTTRAPANSAAPATLLPLTPAPVTVTPIIVTLNGTGWVNVLQTNRSQVESVVKQMIAQSLGISDTATIVINEMRAGSLIINFTVIASNFNAVAATNILATSANVTAAQVFYARCGYNDAVTVLSASLSGSSPPSSPSSSSLPLGLVIGIVAGIIIVLIIAGVIVMKLRSPEHDDEKSESLLGKFASQVAEALPDVELKVGAIEVTLSPQDGKVEAEVDL